MIYLNQPRKLSLYYERVRGFFIASRKRGMEMNNFNLGGLGAFNDQESGEDHRYLPRWKVRNRVKFSLKDGNPEIEECETLDLSCSGLCLVSSRLLIPGQILHMKIYLDAKKTIEVDGHVVWNRIAHEGRYAGINFNSASQETQDEILNYAFESKPDELVKHWFSGWDKQTMNDSDK